MLVIKILAVLVLFTIAWLIHEAANAPTLPSNQDPDYYPTYGPEE